MTGVTEMFENTHWSILWKILGNAWLQEKMPPPVEGAPLGEGEGVGDGDVDDTADGDGLARWEGD